MEISSSNMSSYNNNNYLMTFTSKMSKISDKAYKTKVSFPSKPDYLSNSKISKILNNKTLHKKCRTNNNSFSIKEDINKVNKKKIILYMFKIMISANYLKEMIIKKILI